MKACEICFPKRLSLLFEFGENCCILILSQRVTFSVFLRITLIYSFYLYFVHLPCEYEADRKSVV